jgi:hypothetical protein
LRSEAGHRDNGARQRYDPRSSEDSCHGSPWVGCREGSMITTASRPCNTSTNLSNIRTVPFCGTVPGARRAGTVTAVTV